MRQLPLVMMTSLVIFGCSGTKPENLGVKNGELAPCPGSPNCVSTQTYDKQHRIAPLQYSGSPQEAMERLKRVILSMKRARIVSETGNYLHTEFSSAVFRFVDDVEFFIDDSTKTIQFRSAARLGYSDFGVNRKRMEEIRRRFTAS